MSSCLIVKHLLTEFDMFFLGACKQEAFNYRISARPERRRRFEKELASAVEVALGLLTACLNASELKEQVESSIVHLVCSS